jgi:hypothetical protein
MTKTNPQLYKMSASSIGTFKACPQRFRLAYREGLRPIGDTEAQRVGTNWHAMHEIYHNAITEFEADPDSFATSLTSADYGLSCVVDHLNERYEHTPAWATPTEWDLERQKLLTCFLAYQWYYSNDTIEYLANEIAFDLPIHDLDGESVPLDRAVRVGKIDHLIKWNNMIGVLERKSTTRDIDPSGQYWEKSQKDTQVSMYALAVTDLINHDTGLVNVVPDANDSVGNTLYDVWRRPATKPKFLTQADTILFQESSKYFGQSFDFQEIDGIISIVGEERAETKIGKKGYALKETNRMYAARLLEELTENPERYFQRKEIARTDAELLTFRKELFNIYQAQRGFEAANCWYENENQCRATFACQFIPVCYGPGAESVCDGKTTPDGFRRIFVDLTTKETEHE